MAHLFPPVHNAGAERMLLGLLRPLVARGHRVDVVLSRPHARIPEPYEIDGINVWPHTGKGDPIRFLDDTDVVVTHLENTLRATVLGQMHGIPVVHLCHNTFDLTRQMLRKRPSLAVYNSQWMAEAFAGEDVPSIVVRPPVAVDEYAATPGDAVTLVNLSEAKGAEVFYQLAERFPDTPFLGVEGAYGTQLVDDLPNVEILGHVDGDQMRERVYARTRVLLMPSEYESWGRAGVEAMCSGIPVIAHPTEGLTESLGDAGIFCDRNDIDAWEQALRRLMDGRRWRAASRKARARAVELDPAEDLARWCTAVETLAARRHRVRARVLH